MNNEILDIVDEFRHLNENAMNNIPDNLESMSEEELFESACENMEGLEWPMALSEENDVSTDGYRPLDAEDYDKERFRKHGYDSDETIRKGNTDAYKNTTTEVKNSKNLIKWLFSKALNVFVSQMKKSTKFIDTIMAKLLELSNRGISGVKNYFEAIRRDTPFITLFVQTFAQTAVIVATSFVKLLKIPVNIIKNLVLFITKHWAVTLIPAAVVMIMLSLTVGVAAGGQIVLAILMPSICGFLGGTAFMVVLQLIEEAISASKKIKKQFEAMMNFNFVKGFFSDTVKVIKSMKLSKLKEKFSKAHEDLNTDPRAPRSKKRFESDIFQDVSMV